MLKKLLKYDLKSIFKYWWIAAISSLGLSALGGVCITIISSADGEGIDPPQILLASSTTMLALAIIGLVAFTVLSFILIFIRFYKNFFSDEGYLTFTLPVKRANLLNSKLIASGITMLATSIMLTINILIMLLIGFAKEIFTQSFWNEVAKVLKEIFKEFTAFDLIYIIEALIFILLAIAFSCLSLFCCISFGSIITKKAKVITSIALYYGANCVISFVMQIFYLFGLTSIVSYFDNIPESTLKGIVALIIFGILLFVAIFCGILYTLQYWMLDRKLNLA